MFGPTVSIDLEIIERNARTVVDACGRHGISVFGVTKGACGMPQVARAMLRGGVVGIGESRFENIKRLRDSGIDSPVMLLRSPPLSRIEEVIRSVDISLNSEIAIMEELSRVAERMGRVHEIILMVDLGDLREGIWPADLMPTVEAVMNLPGMRIIGLGTNLTCFGAILPTEDNMSELLAHAYKIERAFGLELRYISGGNSSTLPLVLSGGMPEGINNLRIGEAILQGGRDTFFQAPWEALDQNAFAITGELLEVKKKPSVPIGRTGVDAFGKKPVFEDKGDRLRGIVNIGREDVVVEGLTPVTSGVTVLGASSDHLVVDLTEARPRPKVGDALAFRMDYGALLAAMTSEYVEKAPTLDSTPMKKRKIVDVVVAASLAAVVEDNDFEKRLGALELELNVVKVEDDVWDRDSPDSAGGKRDGIRSRISKSLAAGAIPLLIGADHAVTLDGLEACAESVDAFGLIWFDATASFMPSTGGEKRPPAETVLYRALGYDENHPSVKPQLSPENIVLVGLRDVNPREAEMIRESRIKIFTIVDIDAVGMREVMRQSLHEATSGTRGFYVSYSPAVTDLPGVTGEPGGITVRETHQAMESIASCGSMLAMDVTGLGKHPGPRLCAETAHFILSSFGKQII
ncbi:MAG TPA: alanine racemase [Gammaproteobacteria bacterium]|nr:alanine racemase [Gammaproteobacteria bacterium]